MHPVNSSHRDSGFGFCQATQGRGLPLGTKRWPPLGNASAIRATRAAVKATIRTRRSQVS